MAQRTTLESAAQSAIAYLESLNTRSIAPASTADLRGRLGHSLNANPIPPIEVINDLVRDAEGGLLASSSGRFFAWVIGGTLPAALAADWLTSTWDMNATLYASSPAASVVEDISAEWLKDLLGLPPHASFAIVSGCQLAHVTCLAAARHALLAGRGWDAEAQGLFGAPPLRILAGVERHGSIDRAVRLLGFGSARVEHLAMDAATLEAALREQPSAPAIVILQAGEINTGAFDDFETLIPLAKKYDTWVHIDGAFGLWAAASPRHRHLTRGLEHADSWATDGHKWLNVPFDSGYAFIVDTEAHRAAMSYRAPYLVHDDSARDQIDWNPEWSRRARGFATYAALRELGRNGIADLIDRCAHHAHTLATEIARLPNTELLAQPVINQGLVRFLDPSPGASEAAHDRRTQHVIAAINATGEAFFQGTVWKERQAMRVSVCNWRTTDDDVRRTVACVAAVLCGADTRVCSAETRLGEEAHD